MAHAIDASTRVFCVIGHPVGHSLSPAMHNAALAEMGIDGVYLAFDVLPDALPDAVAGLQALGVCGVNCTIPHKTSLIPLMDELTEEAELVGAVNTILFRDGRRTGHNTDGDGFLAALCAAGVSPEGLRAVVLGAGGAARSIVAALVRAGVRVALANRTVERAEALASEFNDKLSTGPGNRVTAHSLDDGSLGPLLARAQLLVNTTSVGMHPAVDQSPVPAALLHSELFVYDLVYNPLQTRLLADAHVRGARGTHGAGMLAHQGALSLEMWTGRQAPAQLMERVVLESLAARSRVSESPTSRRRE